MKTISLFLLFATASLASIFYHPHHSTFNDFGGENLELVNLKIGDAHFIDLALPKQTVFLKTDSTDLVNETQLFLQADSEEIRIRDNQFEKSKIIVHEWTGAQDSSWNNPLNWNPEGVPFVNDIAVIFNATNHPVLGSFGGQASVASLDIRSGALLRMTDGSAKLTVSGNIQIAGTLEVDSDASPTITAGGSWNPAPVSDNDKGFVPGRSKVNFTGTGTLSRSFYNIQMDSSAHMTSNGDIMVNWNYLRNNGNLTLRSNDTLTCLYNTPDAISGTKGTIDRGTVKRSIAQNSTGQYSFGTSETFVQFNQNSTYPAYVCLTSFPDTLPDNFGQSWVSIPSKVDTIKHVITAKNVTTFETWGIGTAGNLRGRNSSVLDIQNKPKVKHVYTGGTQVAATTHKSVSGTFYDFNLSLQYDPVEVPAGVSESSLILLQLNNATAVNNDTKLPPTLYSLHQNYPNPFNPSTTISYSIPDRTNVTISIYNQLGQKIAVLFNGVKDAGLYSNIWNASDFASGIYFCELSTEKFSSVKKLILLK